MSMMYVVTNTELGWNCVVGVYDTEERANNACKPHPDDLKYFKDNGYLSADGTFDTYHITTKKLNEDH